MNELTKEQIEQAKQYSLVDLLPIHGSFSGNIVRYRCPFPSHRDSTPSFTVYLNTNTWFCFGGCGGGDVISFLQKLTSESFQEVVEYLLKK